jgi:protocatechuate 3,4-dioxygenase beta subunit
MLLAIALFIVTQTTAVGTMEGLVVRDGTNEPVRGAEVRLFGGAPVSTDDNGKFKFQNVPPGAYGMGATHPNYLFGAFGQRGPNRPGRQLTISAGQEVKDIVIQLIPRSALSGRVFARSGDPVRNIQVQLLKYMYVDGRRMLSVAHQVRTNDAGEYRFANVAPEEYLVSAELREPYLPVYFPATVDPDSAASIDLLPGADYGGVDLTLVEEDALHLRGQIVDALTGHAPSSIFVNLLPRERRTLIAGETAPRKISVAADGSFVIDAVPPGSYDLVATLGDGADRRVARVSVVVRRDIEKVNLVLQPVFELRGSVAVEGTATEKDLASVKVALIHQPYITQVNPRPAEVRPDGSFTLVGVMPGDYRVQITSQFAAYVVFARLGGADILNSVVRIDAGNSNPLDIRLKPNASTLDVSVYDDKNTPLEGAQVVLVPEHPNRQRLEVYETAVTDRSGHVRLRNVEPGQYKVFAWEYLESGKWQDADFVRRYEHLGTPVRIGENTTGSVNLRALQAAR